MRRAADDYSMQLRSRYNFLRIMIVVASIAVITWSSAAGATATPNSDVARSPLSSKGDVLSAGELSKSPAVADSTNLVALQWRGDTSVKIAVEARSDSGTWHRVATVGEADGGADSGSVDSVVAAAKLRDGLLSSEPVSVRNVDEVRVRVLDGDLADARLIAISETHSAPPVPLGPGLIAGGAAGSFVAIGMVIPRRRLLGGVAVLIVGGAFIGSSLSSPQAANALIPNQPAIISRAAWGADESLRLASCPDGPNYAQPEFVVVHHTATSNGDTPAQSAATVRSIYTYYVLGRGYCDHGYNFLIDRYGQIFEGRFGGASRGVIGAHATNFNSGSVGIALIGDFSNASPPAAMQDALNRLLVWKMTVNHIDPNIPVATRGAVIDPIIGHRDAGAISGDGTACPGNTGYAILPGLRNFLRANVPIGVPWSNLELSQRTPGSVRFAGWALDPDSPDPVDIHAYVDSDGTRHLADLERPDIGAAFPDNGSEHGFDITLPISPGPHSVCLYAISIGKGRNDIIGCTRTTGSPIGFFEGIGREPGWIGVSGWSLDPDTRDSILVDVYVDGRYIHTTGAVVPRADVAAVFSGYGEPHGFWARVPVGPGLHTVCLWGISVLADPPALIGCRVA